MKRILSIIFCGAMMLAGTNAFAQFSVGAGYLNHSDKFKGDDALNYNGFYVGGFYNFALGDSNLSLTPGLYFSYLGSKSEKSFWVITGTGTYTEMYLNVPLNLRYNFDLASDTRFFVYAGPTFQYGLSSKYKSSASAGSAEINNEVDFFDEDSSYTRADVKLGGGVGFELFDAIQFTVGYKYGLLNRNKNTDPARHQSFINLGVAYLF